MDEERKDGYVAGAILLFLGLIFLVTAFEQGIFGSGKIIGIFSIFSILFGIGSFIKPEIAEVVVHWLNNIQEGNKGSVSQRQTNTKNSHQISNVTGNVTIIQKSGKD